MSKINDFVLTEISANISGAIMVIRMDLQKMKLKEQTLSQEASGSNNLANFEGER